MIVEYSAAPGFEPRRAYPTDVGLDLRARDPLVTYNLATQFQLVTGVKDLPTDWNRVFTLQPFERKKVHTGLSLCMPQKTWAEVLPRSGWADQYGITVLNAPGVIDPDYLGEIKVVLYNSSEHLVSIPYNAPIAQLKLMPDPWATLVQVDSFLDDTDRGENGFGSTGVK